MEIIRKAKLKADNDSPIYDIIVSRDPEDGDTSLFSKGAVIIKKNIDVGGSRRTEVYSSYWIDVNKLEFIDEEETA